MKKDFTIKAVLFDIDGVLLDSLEANLKFVQTILASAGYPKPNKKEFAKVFHLSLIDALRHFAKPTLVEELERIHELVPAIPYPMELLKEPLGVNDALKEISKSYQLGIVSSRRKLGIERYFTFSTLESYFNTYVGYEDTKNHKPHPEPLLLAAKRLCLEPKECVYIGDSHTDMEAGHAARMQTILFGGEKHALANARTDSFKKIPVLIARLETSMLE